MADGEKEALLSTSLQPGTFDVALERWKTHQIQVWNERLRAWGLLRTRAFTHLPPEVESELPGSPRG